MFNILFICHGNICRSVAAEYIFTEMVKQAGLEDRIHIASAAATREEIGSPIYPPMRQTLEGHGVPIGDHQAVQVQTSDYDKFDFIIGMDRENRRDLMRIFNGDPQGKVYNLLAFADRGGAEVFDPWYSRDFEQAYRDICDGCTGLLQYLRDLC